MRIVLPQSTEKKPGSWHRRKRGKLKTEGKDGIYERINKKENRKNGEMQTQRSDETHNKETES